MNSTIKHPRMSLRNISASIGRKIAVAVKGSRSRQTLDKPRDFQSLATSATAVQSLATSATNSVTAVQSLATSATIAATTVQSLATSATALILLTVLCNQGFAQDRVYPKRDAMASGNIAEITPTSVKITVRSKDQTYDMADVRKISFDGEPSSLDRVRESTLLGQYEQALDEVKKISTDAIKNPLIKQDIDFYRYYCTGQLGLAGKADKTTAIKGLLAIASANPRTHHLYELSELLGQLAMAVGQPDQALRYFNVLLSASSPDIKASGVYRLGLVELAQAKVEEAKVRFQQLAGATSASPEMGRLKSLAEVGLAVSEQMLGNTEQALQKLDSMVQQYDSTDQALFARINNAKGASYAAMEQTNQALLSYLQTDLLFFTDAEAHAEALYHLTKLWPQAGQPARGADARERLTTQYPSSPWANKE